MFGMHYTEILIILAVTLIVFGPQRLPELARNLAKMTHMARSATNELRRSLMVDVDLRDPPRRPPAAPPSATHPYKDAYATGPDGGPAEPPVTPADTNPSNEDATSHDDDDDSRSQAEDDTPANPDHANTP